MEEKSLAMTLIDEVKIQSKRKDIIIIILIISLLLSFGGFIWYINQYDYNSESSAVIETENNGSIMTGDIDNG